jgi:hypothetical protein
MPADVATTKIPAPTKVRALVRCINIPPFVDQLGTLGTASTLGNHDINWISDNRAGSAAEVHRRREKGAGTRESASVLMRARTMDLKGAIRAPAVVALQQPGCPCLGASMRLDVDRLHRDDINP